MEAIRWYIAREGQKVGPFESSELRQLALLGFRQPGCQPRGGAGVDGRAATVQHRHGQQRRISVYGFKFGTERNSRLIRGDRRHPFIVRNVKVWETHYYGSGPYSRRLPGDSQVAATTTVWSVSPPHRAQAAVPGNSPRASLWSISSEAGVVVGNPARRFKSREGGTMTVWPQAQVTAVPAALSATATDWPQEQGMWKSMGAPLGLKESRSKFQWGGAGAG
jgi:hypothetical protein